MRRFGLAVTNYHEAALAGSVCALEETFGTFFFFFFPLTFLFFNVALSSSWSKSTTDQYNSFSVLVIQ